MSTPGHAYDSLPHLDDLDDSEFDMENRHLLTVQSPSFNSETKSPGSQREFSDPSSPLPRSSFRSSVGLIPTPSPEVRPPRFEPVSLRLWVVLLGAFLFLGIGIGLEIATAISQDRNGFSVPERNVFSFVSTNFLTSFFPALFVIPIAYAAFTFDWELRAWQPYLLLSKGNATARETLLLDYINENRLMVMYYALKFKHQFIMTSSLVTLATYLMQPLAGSVFSIRQLGSSNSSSVESIRAIGLSPDAADLSAFASAAGFAEASVFNGLSDPPFVYNGWAVAPFVFPTNAYLNGTMAVNTTAIQTQVNCANPIALSLNTSNPASFSVKATSVEGCPLGPVFFDPNNAEQQYGVTNVPSCDGAPADVNFQPVFFWYYQTRQDGQHDARGVFCFPKMQLFDVVAFAFLNNGSLTNVSVIDNYPAANNVTGPPLNDLPFNGLIFNNSSNPNVQARAISIKTGIPNAIFRSAAQSSGGIQSVFDDNNGFLRYTQKVYTQHLALSAKSNYFIPTERTVSAVLTQLVPKLWIDPLAAHALALVSLFVGLATIVIHIIHHRSRRSVYLPYSPGSIATAVSQTSRSGFGDLLMPYDDMKILRKKLQGLRFRLDQRTGAIVVDDSAILYAEPPPGVREETMMTLIGQRHRRMDSAEGGEEFAPLRSPNGDNPHRGQADV